MLGQMSTHRPGPQEGPQREDPSFHPWLYLWPAHLIPRLVSRAAWVSPEGTLTRTIVVNVILRVHFPP